MCNLVTLKASVDEVASAFGARRPRTNAQPGEVYPGGQGFVVREDAGTRALQSMTWGFPVRLTHMKPTSKPKPVNNARDDKLMTFWRSWFTSPAQRARETAELIGLHDVRVDVDLREWDYGGYEGVTTVEIQRERPGWFLFTDGVAPGPPDHPGESPEEVGERADRMLAKVHAALANTEGCVVLVAHGHFLRVLTARYLGLPPGDGALFQLATGALCRLGTEHGRPVITGWNVRPGS